MYLRESADLKLFSHAGRSHWNSDGPLASAAVVRSIDSGGVLGGDVSTVADTGASFPPSIVSCVPASLRSGITGTAFSGIDDPAATCCTHRAGHRTVSPEVL